MKQDTSSQRLTGTIEGI
ncbi:hypothetical protein J0S82_003282 [Galemys pyrenaicus]|uniref:Uncharacterized protein n=1 Tax=Galemys pyrenaicus TaxID=202257 RepID=A0A8J6A355_GALPY|nr:hypothetical protein J0S82_003282 [Galemys pyrenaicus]